MPDLTERRSNLAPWWGLLLALGAIGCNVVLFVGTSAQSAMPLLSLVFAMVAIVFLVIGLKRAFGLPQIYRGKVLSVVLTVVALLPVALTAFAFVVSRKLPTSTAAPQVGQKVPDFSLADTSGKAVTLDQLLSASTGTPAHKAVLLIFYRGYW
jgi:heme/copper-type cytochrome/quinol oxidase subunit 4